MASDNTEEALDDVVPGGTVAANPTLQHQASEGNAADDDDVLATPQHFGFMIPGSVSVGHRPQTRSMTRNQAPIFTRLQAASSRPNSISKLEDAEDIDYASSGGSLRAPHATQSPKGDANVNQVRARKPRGGPLRKSPRSRLKTILRHESTPENIDATSETPSKRRKMRNMASPRRTPSLPLRRSVRLSKPLTEFQKYPELPNELKLAIWEAACEPRLVYIRNRTAPNYSFDVQNAAPSWFNTNSVSAQIASERYRKMFSLHSPDDNRTEQYVNPDMDIVMLEPCCSGCRSYHCARYQFAEKDRLAILKLAVQTESPWLMPSVSPCWTTISLAWPNVETLYLVQTAITGDSKHEKAMIRISSEGDREKELRKRFDEWNKQAGKDQELSKLEFVTVVSKDQYTGAREDIIIG
ncbi:hypothetical protein PG994_009747 [Apiospora phragmitis]|uniref:2EXR domain-containing protein n=1 Tax=Apiospora phragmitis TaxID=2905665 RepID=A0ABR1U9A5_9PEZI